MLKINILWIISVLSAFCVYNYFYVDLSANTMGEYSRSRLFCKTYVI